jgi:hypothetical protein
MRLSRRYFFNSGLKTPTVNKEYRFDTRGKLLTPGDEYALETLTAHTLEQQMIDAIFKNL